MTEISDKNTELDDYVIDVSNKLWNFICDLEKEKEYPYSFSMISLLALTSVLDNVIDICGTETTEFPVREFVLSMLDVGPSVEFVDEDEESSSAIEKDKDQE